VTYEIDKFTGQVFITKVPNYCLCRMYRGEAQQNVFLID